MSSYHKIQVEVRLLEEIVNNDAQYVQLSKVIVDNIIMYVWLSKVMDENVTINERLME